MILMQVKELQQVTHLQRVLGSYTVLKKEQISLTYVRVKEPKWPRLACHKHRDDTFMYPVLFVNFV